MAEQKSINQKIEDLNQAVEWFYGEDFVLEKAPDKYRSTVELAKDIQKDLESLKNKIEVINQDFSKEEA